ncbi:UPF0651 protein, mitochondrial [Sphaceloma murrayae]|uniref:UPF0651 protein, mitochondrial n=1 Tax=Sphaceloma murrayae TaxID=2082308 RepID=A0A2K1QFU3_9PEZI|nr:UPF0651 protein, mitochondrial [Sphaceloma murrayae]
MRAFSARITYRAPTSVEQISNHAIAVRPRPLPSRIVRPGFQRRLKSSARNQAIPLDGYYADILSRSSNQTSDSKPSAVTTAPTPEQPERAELEARARVVFGSRLAGPERLRELEKGSTMVAGVKIPPKPEEPDNCCMSGCVNCVWDRYGEEVEEWAAKSREAKMKLKALEGRDGGARAHSNMGESGQAITGERLATGIGKVPTHVAVSMDDDGGGSDTSWTADAQVGEDDMLGDLSVEIREFIRTEKMLKQRHARENNLGG